MCLLGIIIGGLLPRFVFKVFIQYCSHNDIQIAREAEKFGNFRDTQLEMNHLVGPSQR